MLNQQFTLISMINNYFLLTLTKEDSKLPNPIKFSFLGNYLPNTNLKPREETLWVQQDSKQLK